MPVEALLPAGCAGATELQQPGRGVGGGSLRDVGRAGQFPQLALQERVVGESWSVVEVTVR